MPTSTLSVAVREDRGSPTTRTFLFLVFDGQRPLAPVRRHALEGISEVVFGRGDDAPERAAGKLRIDVPDAYVSTTHAILARRGDGWQVTDRSKNGTVVNGQPIEGAAAMEDGDILEIGSAFFILRTDIACLEGDPEDLSSDTMTAPHDGMLTLVPALDQLYRKVERLARAPISVVLRGETGTGKEVLARALHKLSRRSGAFVAVNCGALPDALIESELFGSKKGAFSGAVEDRPGLVRSSDKGTLMLDEVGDLPLQSQAAFLRVLQEREVVPVGDSKPVKVDLRVVSASHFNLHELVAAKKFRADLEARLAGIEIELLPLRERREDLGLLTASILRRVVPELAGSVVFDRTTARAMLVYGWPKNIRELERVLTSAVVLAGNMPVATSHLPATMQVPRTSGLPEETDDDTRLRQMLVTQLEQQAGNVSAIARALGKPRKQVQRWLKKYTLDAEKYRKPKV